MFLKCLLLLVFLVEIIALESLPCPNPKFKNGRFRMKLRRQLAKFACNPGFELIGSKYASCRNGEWDEPIPVCVKPGCGYPTIENGVAVASNNDALFIFFCYPKYQLIGSSAIYCDGRRSNDTAPHCAPTPEISELSCDFESPSICGWKQDEQHDFDWKRLNKKTPSSFLFTGPSFDHTYGPSGSGYYMYIESTSRLENDTARLISPIYDASLTLNGCFQFFYHMFGKTTGGLRVYQKPLKKEEKYLLFEQWGDKGDFWYTGVVSLHNTSDDFQIIIEGIRGRSFTSDIAVDDVAVLQGDNCTVLEKTATTPPTTTDTCSDRCSASADKTSCGCNIICLMQNNCCLDFFDLCVFDKTETTTEPIFSDIPQTQKLIYSTEKTETSPTTTPSTVPTTTKVTKTTIKPMTLVFKTTKSIPKVELPTEKVTTLKTIATTIKPTTVRIVNTTVMAAKANEEDKLKERTGKESLHSAILPGDFITSETKSAESSGVKTTVVVISTLLICVSMIWVALYMRSAGGREVVARLRGRTRQQHDVRYLTDHEDDD